MNTAIKDLPHVRLHIVACDDLETPAGHACSLCCGPLRGNTAIYDTFCFASTDFFDKSEVTFPTHCRQALGWMNRIRFSGTKLECSRKFLFSIGIPPTPALDSHGRQKPSFGCRAPYPGGSSRPSARLSSLKTNVNPAGKDHPCSVLVLIRFQKETKTSQCSDQSACLAASCSATEKPAPHLKSNLLRDLIEK